MRKINQNKRIINTGKVLTDFKSTLLQAQNEVDYFLDVLNDLKTKTIGNSVKSLRVARFVQEFHHFERLIKRLLQEHHDLHHDLAEDAQEKAMVDSETFGDIRYFKSEMKDFENNYKEYKYKFRAFVADFDYLSKEVA
ncbi:hypothetical protein [Jiulongibacter sp. NS-SX5]|uniref:hypothetical protein n=1 Tax=Jiulongibacter sp. NS-SX5 TaxID=3463854 RepID=UPI004059C3EF